MKKQNKTKSKPKKDVIVSRIRNDSAQYDTMLDQFLSSPFGIMFSLHIMRQLVLGFDKYQDGKVEIIINDEEPIYIEVDD